MSFIVWVLELSATSCLPYMEWYPAILEDFRRVKQVFFLFPAL